MLQEIKDYLKITWEDEDAGIQKIIDRGKNYFNDLTGVELNFDENNQAKTLLLDYCRYAYNNALEYFEDNFQKEILRLQLKEAVKDNEDKV
ncbi:phage head-tail connector protein [Sedimentibacter hydroxybenzoicus DSM 7310]|uniref:Phage head-tail connector protein n=1 Tax=Sedimentibacter hydroxybenzoicus DSM 7310 TaxID=1123245 RepID=A0A974BIS8_SEDHY|nr:head-tail connector protein [Sedimentibacter hydroxybenzoicus]NYB73858.1 phage head-tail connector protein [Sedimentibacter hydroxybenzoicus DSM 7310]